MPVPSKIMNTVQRTVLILVVLSAASKILAADNTEDDDALQLLTEPLLSVGIEVHKNLNGRDIARRRPERPRLGGFADLPLGRMPRTEEIDNWESDFQAMKIAGVALLRCDECSGILTNEEFLTQWLGSESSQRSFLSYFPESSEAAEKIAETAAINNFHVKHLRETDLTFAAELFATSGQRLGLDTRAARTAKSEVAELDFLGQRQRRKSDSIFRDSNRLWRKGVSQNEPANFIKESLGDEFTQSTIREVIVPGGVALGETARFKPQITALKFDGKQLLVIDGQGKEWTLPEQRVETTKALFDFVQRSHQLNSDAIVDIDGEGRVRISSTLRDTDAGWQIMDADTQPFQFVRNLDVTKSVIIDTFVSWKAVDDSSLGFDSEFEVRFLSADNMRIAQTRAALVYTYESMAYEPIFRSSWGRDKGRLKENLDTDGLGSSLRKVADYSGWVALFRTVLEDDNVDFLAGRYQFMKIDKSGRKTPARY